MKRYAYKFPRSPDMISDPRHAIEKFILPGFLPEKPLITLNDSILTIGSCFADHIGDALQERGANVYRVKRPENLNSPVATATIFRRLDQSDEDAQKARKYLENTKLMILTAGVAPHPFRNGVPVLVKGEVSRETQWRMLTLAEIRDALHSVMSKAKEINPFINIVLTISPIPLEWSTTHESPFAADCVSKSLLRVAVEDILNEKLENIYYWPSFEMIRWLGGHIGPFFGVGGEDNRHIFQDTLDLIMEIFLEKYCSSR
jgi:hypothetical protein